MDSPGTVISCQCQDKCPRNDDFGDQAKAAESKKRKSGKADEQNSEKAQQKMNWARDRRIGRGLGLVEYSLGRA